MKGSPMQRNFGIGSPMRQDTAKLAKTQESQESQESQDKSNYDAIQREIARGGNRQDGGHIEKSDLEWDGSKYTALNNKTTNKEMRTGATRHKKKLLEEDLNKNTPPTSEQSRKKKQIKMPPFLKKGSPYTFDKDAVNKARKKRIGKRMADPDISMDKWSKNLERYRKDKEKGRY